MAAKKKKRFRGLSTLNAIQFCNIQYTQLSTQIQVLLSIGVNEEPNVSYYFMMDISWVPMNFYPAPVRYFRVLGKQPQCTMESVDTGV